MICIKRSIQQTNHVLVTLGRCILKLFRAICDLSWNRCIWSWYVSALPSVASREFKTKHANIVEVQTQHRQTSKQSLSASFFSQLEATFVLCPKVLTKTRKQPTKCLNNTLCFNTAGSQLRLCTTLHNMLKCLNIPEPPKQKQPLGTMCCVYV